jgi:hypothetical protein
MEVFHYAFPLAAQVVQPLLDNRVSFGQYKVVSQELLAVPAAQQIIVGAKSPAKEPAKGAEGSALQRIRFGFIRRGDYESAEDGTFKHQRQRFPEETRL